MCRQKWKTVRDISPNHFSSTGDVFQWPHNLFGIIGSSAGFDYCRFRHNLFPSCWYGFQFKEPWNFYELIKNAILKHLIFKFLIEEYKFFQFHTAVIQFYVKSGLILSNSCSLSLAEKIPLPIYIFPVIE